jgi:hypothetical protein
MKKIILITACFFFFQCKKHTTGKLPTYKLTYEVITSSGSWFGEYKDSTGNHIQTSTSMPSGWKYTFYLKSLPFAMFVNATTTCVCAASPSSPDVTINFYSNDTLFKTETNTWAKGVTSLEFELR